MPKFAKDKDDAAEKSFQDRMTYKAGDLEIEPPDAGKEDGAEPKKASSKTLPKP